MKTIAIISQLRGTDEYDGRAPYVYMEVTQEDAERMAAVEKLCEEAVNRPGLKDLARIAVRGPAMYALASLPPLNEEQGQQLEDNEYITLEASIPEEELPHADVILCCEELHYFVGIGWYAIANDKHTRDIYEADLVSLNAHLSRL